MLITFDRSAPIERRYWKHCVTPSFHFLLRISLKTPATSISSVITPIQSWRMKMIRNSLFAIAAALMTLTAFSGTLAVMTAGEAGSAQAVPVA